MLRSRLTLLGIRCQLRVRLCRLRLGSRNRLLAATTHQSHPPSFTAAYSATIRIPLSTVTIETTSYDAPSSDPNVFGWLSDAAEIAAALGRTLPSCGARSAAA